MALFVNPGKDWEKNMSEEDIAQMESQGYDVTEPVSYTHLTLPTKA